MQKLSFSVLIFPALHFGVPSLELWRMTQRAIKQGSGGAGGTGGGGELGIERWLQPGPSSSSSSGGGPVLLRGFWTFSPPLTAKEEGGGGDLRGRQVEG